MTPVFRKVLYAVSFEIIGILIAGLALMALAGADPVRSFSLSALAATIAMAWSYAFNSLFEAWEARQASAGRSRARRAAHAILFEGGLLAILLPLTAWWLGVSLWTALILEGWLIAVFILYTYLFTWAFDAIFGLPQSAR
ncbi:MAG: PACE efflux transporter [Paracoccaceae bacterium]